MKLFLAFSKLLLIGRIVLILFVITEIDKQEFFITLLLLIFELPIQIYFFIVTVSLFNMIENNGAGIEESVNIEDPAANQKIIDSKKRPLPMPPLNNYETEMES